MQLLIASSNVHKIREFREIFKVLERIDLISLLDFPNYQPPEETGKTFEENALLKATHAASALKKWVIADDSGLVVPALKGAPGVFSARYAGEQATDAENRRKLLKEMHSLTDLDRSAYFECCLAIIGPKGFKKCMKCICEGLITTEERGNKGFGYDSLFLKNDYNKTFAELDESVKNKISHRRKAFDKLLIVLEGMRGE